MLLLCLPGRRHGSGRRKRRPSRSGDLLGLLRLLRFLCLAVAALLTLGHLTLLDFHVRTTMLAMAVGRYKL
jgi:hypothetical protein